MKAYLVLNPPHFSPPFLCPLPSCRAKSTTPPPPTPTPTSFFFFELPLPPESSRSPKCCHGLSPCSSVLVNESLWLRTPRPRIFFHLSAAIPPFSGHCSVPGILSLALVLNPEIFPLRFLSGVAPSFFLLPRLHLTLFFRPFSHRFRLLFRLSSELYPLVQSDLYFFPWDLSFLLFLVF